MSNIINNKLTDSEQKYLKESFSLMDNDSDGYLDYYEMKAALKALGLTVKKSYILAIMRMYDKYGYNKISFEDFNYIVSEKLNKRNPIDEIQYVFKLFIKDSPSNEITLKELERFNKKFNCNLTFEEMELMIKEFDLDHNVNESEFINIMTDLGI
ncbi:cell division control protein 31-like isoform X1 [Osmia bicornis bicornis]|uniref:cell division control protein 31-like isoform X1 n=1 Tax=Osmia bicornis bicornis TaxID=1437191 RepID=UPI0010F78590|nr:cell division control protein 31-like isoform X1 [Osmia bicornis bicornis]